MERVPRKRLGPPRSREDAAKRRSTTLQMLPSFKLSRTSMVSEGRMSATKKSRLQSIEMLKLRRGSSVSERITFQQAEDIAKFLESRKVTERENPMEQLKQMHAKLAVKKRIRQILKIQQMLQYERKEPFYVLLVSALTHLGRILGCVCARVSNFFDFWTDKIKYIHGRFGAGVASYFIFLRYLLLMNILNIIIVVLFVVGPQAYRDVTYGSNTTANVKFHFTDLLTGEGWLENTLLYYARYTNQTFHSYTHTEYDLPVAYIITTLAMLFGNLIIVAYSLSVAYRKSTLLPSQFKTDFCTKVFTSWDYSVQNSVVASLRKERLYTDLMGLLSSQHKKALKRSWWKLTEEVLLCIVITVFVLALTFTLCYAMYRRLNTLVYQSYFTVLETLSVAMTLTAAVFLFHHVLKYLSTQEFYLSKENRIYLTVMRVCVLRLAMLGILSYFWSTSSFVDPFGEKCPEELQGEEIYRLVVINFVADTFLLLSLAWLWRLVNPMCSPQFLGVYPEFNVAFHTNDLMYYQLLVWTGVFYVPLMPLMFIVITVLNFYLMSFSLRYCFKTSDEIWGSSRSQAMFLLILLINFFFAAMEVGHTIFYEKPSQYCGPFAFKKSVYSAVTKVIRSLIKKDITLGTFITVVESPSFMLTILLIILVAADFARAYAAGQYQTMKQLEEQVVQEGKDKVFLMQLYESIEDQH